MVRSTILCSPKLLQGMDRPDPARLIASCDLLHVKIEDRPWHSLWDMMARCLGRPALSVDLGLVFDTAQLAVQYALSGEGLALADPELFQDEVKAGRLVRPFDISLDEGYGYYLTTPPQALT